MRSVCSVRLSHHHFARGDGAVLVYGFHDVYAALRCCQTQAAGGVPVGFCNGTPACSCRGDAFNRRWVEVGVVAVEPGSVGGELIGGSRGGARHAEDPFAAVRIAAHAFFTRVGHVAQGVAPRQVTGGENDALAVAIAQFEAGMQLAERVELVGPDDEMAVGRDEGADGVGTDAVFCAVVGRRRDTCQ